MHRDLVRHLEPSCSAWVAEEVLRRQVAAEVQVVEGAQNLKAAEAVVECPLEVRIRLDSQHVDFCYPSMKGGVVVPLCRTG